MPKTLSLSKYVKKRNGVALGAPGSMRNMLKRSLGADSFYLFWRYWNPIWGYYLSRYVMRPLVRVVPYGLAVILTFLVSGGLHDLAVSLVKWQVTFFFTPWFLVMSLWLLVTKRTGLSFHRYRWPVRGFFNILWIALSLLLTVIGENGLSAI